MEIDRDSTATYYVDSDSLTRNEEIVSLTKKAVYRVSLWPVQLPDDATVKETGEGDRGELQEQAPSRDLDGHVQPVRRAHLVVRKDEAHLGKCRAQLQWGADSRIRLRLG